MSFSRAELDAALFQLGVALPLWKRTQSPHEFWLRYAEVSSRLHQAASNDHQAYVGRHLAELLKAKGLNNPFRPTPPAHPIFRSPSTRVALTK